MAGYYSSTVVIWVQISYGAYLVIREIYAKDVTFILEISKQEAFDMRKIVGESNVLKSHSRHAKYYLVESNYNLRALNKYRKSKLVKES